MASENVCIWNEFELKKPPLVTIEVEHTEFGGFPNSTTKQTTLISIFIQSPAQNVFVSINKFLQQLSNRESKDFNETAALIGRLMARRKNSFRNMPGFRSVCKLNAALCRLLRLDLARDLEQFRGVLPDVYDEELSGELPTRSSFEFVLVRLLGFYHLHERIRECCLTAASYFTKLLRNNYFMDFTTLLIAAIAKIHKLSAGQASLSANLYNHLRIHCEKFPQVEKHIFLKEHQELPAKLERIKSSQNQEEEETTPSVLLRPKEVITRMEKAKSDVGTVIARKESPAQVSTKTEFNENVLATVEDAQKFIARETTARKQQPPPENCFTKKIPKHEWLAAQTLFHKKLPKDPAKALSIFRKYILSKIK
ncbi:hypothetical protein KR009_009791 [Drosophila setifemur]|nr:hypothetical protein KR009_009791 [Drosophila setifemur]